MKLTNKRNVLVGVVVVMIVILVVTSLFVYFNPQKPNRGNVEQVTVGMIAHETYSLIYTAQDQQYFLNNGLNVTLKYYPNGVATVNGLLNGESNIATASEFVLAQQGLQNRSIYSFATVAKATTIYIVARTDKGISNVSDLKDKTIGVNFGSNSQFYLGRFLELNNINQNQVNLVNINPLQPLTVLVNDTADAVVTLQPFLSQTQNLFANRTVIWSVQADQPSFYEAICIQSYASAHPDTLVRFLKALSQAETFGADHPDQAMAIVAKNLNYTSSYTATVWPDYQFSLSLDQTLVIAMKDEAQWMINNHLTNQTQVPNFDRLHLYRWA